MTIWKMPITLELLKSRSANTFVEFIGIEFTEISKHDQGCLRETLQLLIKKGIPLSKPYI